MIPVSNNTIMPLKTAFDLLCSRTKIVRMLATRRNVAVAFLVAAYVLSVRTTTQVNQIIYHESADGSLDAIIDRPFLRNSEGPKKKSSLPLNSASVQSEHHDNAVSRFLPLGRRSSLKGVLVKGSTEPMETQIVSDLQPNRFAESLNQPSSENTVISLIAMGTARENRLAERCIRSIRAAGKFTGYIMLFTDSKGFKNYEYSLSWDPKVIVIQGLEEDMLPTSDSDTAVHMKAETMVYQRFKTLVPKYIAAFVEIRNTAEYIFYLDVDNVVAQDLNGFFHDYYVKIVDDLNKDDNATSKAIEDYSFFSFWKERKHFQGGQFIAHRKHGKGCLDAWRTEFDKGDSRKDQPLLMNVYNNFDTYHCAVHQLPFGNSDEVHKSKHFDLFTGNVYEALPADYPTIVHLTGFRTRHNSESSQRSFLRKALRLENTTETVMVGNITWAEVLTPVGPKGHRPPPKEEEEEETDDEEDSTETDQDPEGSDDAEEESDTELLDEESEMEPENNVESDTNVASDDDETDASLLDEDGELMFLNETAITIERPSNENTAIALIAMGKSGSSSYIAERCIRSIRTSGNFTGYVLLFTDDEGYERKKESFSFDPKVLVVRGSEEDLRPTDLDGTEIEYHGMGHMLFKRFKTLISKYLDADPQLQHIQYGLYLDVDNIVANNLSRFFDHYAVTISRQLAGENSTDFDYFSFWRDPGRTGMKRGFWQGGQIMFDRYRSVGCFDAWRNEMDTVWGPMDQPLLMNVYNNFTRYGCKIFELPDHNRHFTLLSRHIVKGKAKTLPTIVHITSLRTKKFKGIDQENFIRDALHIYNETEMLNENISWYEVAKPVDARGKVPKKKKAKKEKIAEAAQ